MTENTYVNKAELQECFVLSAVLSGLEELINCCDKPMSTYFKTAFTNAEKAWKHRMSFLDDVEKKKLERRLDHCEIVARQKGVNFSTEEPTATVNECDLMDLAEKVAEIKCFNCKKKEKSCEVAKIFNRLCLPCVDGVKDCRYALRLDAADIQSHHIVIK